MAALRKAGLVVKYAWRLCAGNQHQRKHARYVLTMGIKGIDLSSMTVEELGLEKTRSECYGDSGGPDLEYVLENLKVGPQDAILDLGCGKGGAMYSMAKFPFARVDGIDLCPDMIKTAERNLARLGFHHGKMTLQDAVEFTDYDSYTFVYLFHPFLESVTQGVLENMKASLRRAPRRFVLIYKNPAYHDAVIAAGFRQIAHFDHAVPPFRVYEFGPSSERMLE